MRKPTIILSALLACLITTPIMRASTSAPTTTKSADPFADLKRAVKDAEANLKKARKGGKSDEITAAQKTLDDARKVLSDAQKQKQKSKSDDL